jgi:Cys-tRNA(Pro)/Cys-tRNA(Cys) deacylase
LNNFKTNAMRIIDKAGITYNTYNYDHSDGVIDGISVAKKIGQPEEHVYKTLVTQGTSREYYVFVIPVADELDLKVAANVVKQKSIEMIKATDINKITGYIRGGCSPIGMKKEYKTVIDSSCRELNTLIISDGKIGHQIELSPKDLISLIDCNVQSVIIKKTKY